jgi:hypothetical protein
MFQTGMFVIVHEVEKGSYNSHILKIIMIWGSKGEDNNNK